MKRRRVRPTAHNGWITPVVRVTEFECIRNLRINLILPLCICCCHPGALVSFSGNVHRVLHQRNLIGRLPQTHLNEDRGCVLEVVTRTSFGPVGGEELFLTIFDTVT